VVVAARRGTPPRTDIVSIFYPIKGSAGVNPCLKAEFFFLKAFYRRSSTPLSRFLVAQTSTNAPQLSSKGRCPNAAGKKPKNVQHFINPAFGPF
jgi:hypothetical protein